MNTEIKVSTEGLMTVADVERFAASCRAAGIPGNTEVLMSSPSPNDGVRDVLSATHEADEDGE